MVSGEAAGPEDRHLRGRAALSSERDGGGEAPLSQRNYNICFAVKSGNYIGLFFLCGLIVHISAADI